MMPSKFSLASCAALLMLLANTSCDTKTLAEPYALATFRVTVTGLTGDANAALAVVTTCANRYGGGATVPAEVRGTRECPFAIPVTPVTATLGIEAIGRGGEVLTDFNGPVSFRVTPGELTGAYDRRTTTLTNGVGTGTLSATFLYSEVRFWVEDGPVTPIKNDLTTPRPAEPELRTYATGLAAPVYFDDPTLQTAQYSGGEFDNTLSPFMGQYLTIGREPNGDDVVRQSCSDDPERDGQPAKLVVTGMDPGGFFVTDITACRLKERVTDGSSTVRVPEPNGFYPGTFGSMYIYNYSFPEGLEQGDLVWAVAGSAQEFTATTQLTFPSWILRERARDAEEAQWGRFLAEAPPTVINLRMCGLDNTFNPYITDSLCGHSRSNLKMESVESGLVTIRNIKVPGEFRACDRNGDSQVSFFCDVNSATVGCDPNVDQNCASRVWRDCGGTGPWDPAAPANEEVVCNIDCVIGQGEFASSTCSERGALRSFGQFVAELPGPGPDDIRYDTSLPTRVANFPLAAGTTAGSPALANRNVRIWCDAPVNYRWGAGASASDTALAAGQVAEHFVTSAENTVSFFSAAGGGTCHVAINPRTKINIVTRDAIPQIEPDCSSDIAVVGEERAAQCRNFRGATYNVTGHLRHVQAGRPRWVVLPRDADDLCCYPGEGLECPTPIKPCP